MDHVVVVSGADRGLGWALCQELLQRGWQVVAGQYMPQWPDLAKLGERFAGKLHIVPLDISSMASVRAAAAAVEQRLGHVDLLINNAGIIEKDFARTIRQGLDYDQILNQCNVNALGAIRTVEALLPLLDRGTMRRLCFVSSEASSIASCKRAGWFGYCMSKTALNMGVKILFSDLRPQGYTFRLYHPGWMRSYMHGEKNLQASLEPEAAASAALAYFLSTSPIDEDTLVLRDLTGQNWPW